MELKTEEFLVEAKEDDAHPFNLSATAKEFGIDYSKIPLTKTDIFVLYLSQKLDKYIKDLQIPVAVKESETGKKQLIEKEVEKTIEKTTYTEGDKPTSLPADQMDVKNIEAVEDLPNILRPQWLYESIAPELFYKDLADKRLQQPQWFEHFKEKKVSIETIKEKELVEVPTPPEKKELQHAYLCIDVSRSMGEAMDGRDVLAKGLALAYLKRGFSQGSQLAIRPFCGRPLQLMEAKDSESYHALAAKVLHMSMRQGGTDIQSVLEYAVNDIKRQGKYARADILLLTDGGSPLSLNPLGDIHLHTFIFGFDESNELLPGWSKTFRKINLSEIPEGLEPTKEDIKDFEQVFNGYMKKLLETKDRNAINGLKMEAQTLNALMEIFIQSKTGDRRRLNRMNQQLSDLAEEIRNGVIEKIIDENIEKEQAEIARRKAEEAERLRKEKEAKEKAQQELNQMLSEYENYKNGQQPIEKNQEEYEQNKKNEQLPQSQPQLNNEEKKEQFNFWNFIRQLLGKDKNMNKFEQNPILDQINSQSEEVQIKKDVPSNNEIIQEKYIKKPNIIPNMERSITQSDNGLLKLIIHYSKKMYRKVFP